MRWFTQGSYGESMELTSKELVERATSSFPLSIGTGLAFESLMDGTMPAYDPAREVPDRINLNNYQELWVNVETLHRNMMGSMPSQVHASVNPDHVVEELVEEKDIIASLVRDATNDRVRVVFYHNDKSSLAKHHPHATVRKPHTDKQLFAKHMEERVIHTFLKELRDDANVVKHARLIKPMNKPRALVLTHQAYDLLSYKAFDEFDLLESHTGLLKNKSAWYTKFNEKNLVRIPFNVCTLQVFGDSISFQPFAQTVRKELVELAEHHKWTPMTTDERMVLCFSLLKDVFLGQTLKAMMAE